MGRFPLSVDTWTLDRDDPEEGIRGDEELPAGVQGGRGRAVPVGPEGDDQVGRQGSGGQPRDAAELGAGRRTPSRASPRRRRAAGGTARGSRRRLLEEENRQLRARGSGSWRRSGRSCARRRSISRGRRAGEPLPVRRGPPAPFGVKRLCRILGVSRSELLLLAPDGAPPGPPGRPAEPELAARIRRDPPGVGRHLRRPAHHRRAARDDGERGQPQAGRAGHARRSASRACACARRSAPPSPSRPRRRRRT